MKRSAYLLLSLLICFMTVSAENPSVTPANRILFLMHTGSTSQALEAYQALVKETGSHDFELLEQIGLTLLDQGFRSKDPETQLVTLFGAGASLNEKTLYIIEDALSDHDHPELVLIALHLLARFQNDRADQILLRAMISDFLIIRLEAALELAKKKDPKAVRQIEALMAKLPEQLWSIFPQLYALLDTPEAKKILRKLMANSHEQVRVAAIHSAAKYGHDDFIPTIKRLASHHEPSQQEACAAALGVLRDESSTPRLQELAKSQTPAVRLAALNALYTLGHLEVRTDIEALAKKQDLFAITLLGGMKGSENILAALAKTSNLHVAMNAAIALLKLGDRRCLPLINELLLNEIRDYGLLTITTPGKSLTAFRVTPSARQNFEEDPVALELSLSLREALLTKAIELPEKDFLYLAHALLEKQQNDLLAALMEVLKNHPTPAVIELLKKHQQKAGAPLIRNYCNLALYCLKQPGPYGNNLREWVTQQRNVDLISFRPLLSIDVRDGDSDFFQLTPQETSRLLIEAFEAFVATQDDKGIDMLISVIQNGNPKNKYALIGLLMRAIQ